MGSYEVAWEKWLDARLWATYFSKLGGYRRRLDWAFTILVALAGSSAIASGTLVVGGWEVWKLFTGGAVIITILRPFILDARKTALASHLAGRWIERVAEWEKIKVRADQGSLIEEQVINQAIASDAEVAKEGVELPDYRWLVRRSQHEIKIAEGILQPDDRSQHSAREARREGRWPKSR